MNTLWRKAVRDFRQERARTVLVVAAIAIGIAGFSAVLTCYAVLTRDIRIGYLATNPASATLHTDALDDATIAAVRADRAISDAEERRSVSGSIKTGPAQWRNLILFVVPDYSSMRVYKFVPEKGAWPPATGEMLVERDAFRVARAKIGDTVTFKIGSGKEQTLRISGQVHDVDQPQARMENSVYGYITTATLESLGVKPYFDQLNIVVAEDRFDQNHIRSVSAGVKSLLESRGHLVNEVDIPPPGKHPHGDLMATLLLQMSSFGLLVLLMSGILVVNLLMAIMAAQVRQIGMMKTVGGTRSQVARIYFGQALLLGLVATVVALPLGMLGARPLCRAFAQFLNFDITTFAVPAWLYALVLAVGVAVPLLAAAWPVWKGSAVSIREALATYGVSQAAFGTSLFDRVLGSIGGSFRPLALSVRNSFRRRARLALTLLTLAASGLFFMSALNIRGSMMNTLDHTIDTRRFDLQMFLDRPYPAEKIERAVRKTPGIVAAESWFSSSASIPENTPSSAGVDAGVHGVGGGLHGGGSAGAFDRLRFPIVALPANPKMIRLKIVRGHNLQPGDLNGIVVNSKLAEVAGVSPGDTITLRFGPAISSWHVVGVAREPFFPSVAYVPLQFVDEHHPGLRTNVGFTLEKSDPASINAAKAALDSNLEQEGIRVVSSQSKAEWRMPFDQHYLMIFVFLMVISGMIAAVGGLGLATTMSLNVMERRREMGILRAIGASPGVLMRIVAAEAATIGVLSWILAGLGAGPLSRLVGNAVTAMLFRSRLDTVVDLRGLWIWLALSVIFAALASLLPARAAARLTVREALAYE